MYFSKWIAHWNRLALISVAMLSALALSAPALAQSSAEYCYVESESGQADQCFSTFQAAFNAATNDAHGYHMRLYSQHLDSWSPSWDEEQSYDVIRYEFIVDDQPPEEFLSSGYRARGTGVAFGPACGSYTPPNYMGQLCSSEGETSNRYAELLLSSGGPGDTVTPDGVTGAWNVSGYGTQPWLLLQPENLPQYGVIEYIGKTGFFLYCDEDECVRLQESYYRLDPYRCPIGTYAKESSEDDWDPSMGEPAPNKCRAFNRSYAIIKKLTFGCSDPCDGGVNLSQGTQTVREHIFSLDGVDIELAYGSASRTWSLGFDKRIHEGVDAPLLEVAPGLFARLDSVGTSSYSIQGRPNELVWLNADDTYSYRAAGYEYRFDFDGRVASFGAIGTLLTKVTRDDEGKIISLKTPNGRVVDFTYTAFKLTEISGGGYAVGIAYDSYNNISEISSNSVQLRKFLYGEPGLAAASDFNLLTGILSDTGQREKNYGYDASGRLTRRSTGTIGSETGVETHAYPDATHAVTVTASGDTRTYEFINDAYRRPLSIVDSAGTVTNEYDADSRLKMRSDALGSITNYVYAPLYEKSRTVAVGSSQQRRIETDRDTKFGNIKVRRIYDAAGTLVAKEAWTYNTRGQVLTAARTDPATNATRTTTITYCESAHVSAGTCPRIGLVTSINGSRTDVIDTTSYTYRMTNEASCATAPATCPYRKGDLWKVTNASGQITETLAYDGAGRVLSVKDANGVITDLEYHPRGWLTARKTRGANAAVETDDAITRIEYWPTGLVKKVIQPDGAFTSYTYDVAHRLTDISDNAGNNIHYTLNNAGKRIKEDTRDPATVLKRTLSRVFNQLGQLQTQADAQANPTDFTYDANGNTNTVTDALGRVTDNDYDPLGRLSRTLQDVGGINAETQFAYDAQDNLTQVTDPKGLSTTYTYNGLGDLTQLSSPDTGTTSYTYDSAGNRATQTDARNQTSTYSYDALNRLTGIAYATPGLNVAYTYDSTQAPCSTGETFSVGRLTGLTDASGSTQYCYDRFGNLVRKVQTTNGVALTVRYAYTLAGQLSSVIYPDGATASYVRDAQGRTTQVNVQRAGAASEVLLNQASYHPFGPVTFWTYGNGRQLQRPLNQNYQPTAIHDAGPGGLSVGFQYDPVGNVTQLTPVASTIPLVKFDYDTLSRLTAFKDGPTNVAIESYAYDATGNRQSFTNAGGTQAYTYPSTSHRLSQVGATARTYDNAGNTTAIGGLAKEFVYDDTGRMSQVKQNAIVQMNYAYNGKGEQVRKHQGTVNAYTVYDEAGHWLGDYDNTGAALQQAIWMDDLPVGLIANGNQLHYIEPDHLGTPRVVIEVARNASVWTWDLKSEAFGNSVPNQDPDLDANQFVFGMRFPGQHYDAASGLNQNGYRDYESATGRYPQSDPIGLDGGISTYAYAHSQPTRMIDPLGLQSSAAARGAAGAYRPYPNAPNNINPDVPSQSSGGWSRPQSRPEPKPTIEVPFVERLGESLFKPVSALNQTIAQTLTNVVDMCTGVESEKDRCRKADDRCFEQCEIFLGGKDGGTEYVICWRSCMKAAGCYGGNGVTGGGY